MRSNPGTPLIIAAMRSELRHALDVVHLGDERRIGPWRLWSGELDERPVHLLQTGIGMVSAGAALARSLAEIRPACILNFGCAGAHLASIRPGDVVVGERYIHHRSTIVLPDGSERHAGTFVDPEDTEQLVSGFDADPDLLQHALFAGEDWTPRAWVPEYERTPEFHRGPVASADVWTQSTRHIEEIHRLHGTLCEDMEAAALALVAAMHNLPFLAIKDISNNEFDVATVHGAAGPSLADVEHEVGARAFELVRRTLQRLPR